MHRHGPSQLPTPPTNSSHHPAAHLHTKPRQNHPASHLPPPVRSSPPIYTAPTQATFPFAIQTSSPRLLPDFPLAIQHIPENASTRAAQHRRSAPYQQTL